MSTWTKNEQTLPLLEDLLNGITKTCNDYLENSDDCCGLNCPFFHICMRMNFKIKEHIKDLQEENKRDY